MKLRTYTRKPLGGVVNGTDCLVSESTLWQVWPLSLLPATVRDFALVNERWYRTSPTWRPATKRETERLLSAHDRQVYLGDMDRNRAWQQAVATLSEMRP